MDRREFSLGALATVAAAQFPLIRAAQAQAIGTLKMMIPANPGGGWDQTGRALASADHPRWNAHCDRPVGNGFVDDSPGTHDGAAADRHALKDHRIEPDPDVVLDDHRGGVHGLEHAAHLRRGAQVQGKAATSCTGSAEVPSSLV